MRPNFTMRLEGLTSQRVPNEVAFLTDFNYSESLFDIRRLLDNNTAVLEQVAKRTKALRTSHPTVKAPESIYEASYDTQSIYGNAASTLGASEFEFDDLIVNSRVYRRASQKLI